MFLCCIQSVQQAWIGLRNITAKEVMKKERTFIQGQCHRIVPIMFNAMGNANGVGNWDDNGEGSDNCRDNFNGKGNMGTASGNA